MPADELKQEAGAKSGVILRINVKPGLPAGPFEQRIRLRMNLPGHPEADLPVEGRVSGPIEVVSPALEWDSEHGILRIGQIRAAEGAKAPVWLIVRDADQKRIEFKLSGT